MTLGNRLIRLVRQLGGNLWLSRIELGKMHRHKQRRITKERLEKFVSKDYFVDANIYGQIYGMRRPLTSITTCAVPDRIPLLSLKYLLKHRCLF